MSILPFFPLVDYYLFLQILCVNYGLLTDGHRRVIDDFSFPPSLLYTLLFSFAISIYLKVPILPEPPLLKSYHHE